MFQPTMFLVFSVTKLNYFAPSPSLLVTLVSLLQFVLPGIKDLAQKQFDICNAAFFRFCFCVLTKI